MGYSLEERAEKISYISEQKWTYKCKGEAYLASNDPKVRASWPEKEEMCKNTPRSLIKYIRLYNVDSHQILTNSSLFLIITCKIPLKSFYILLLLLCVHILYELQSLRTHLNLNIMLMLFDLYRSDVLGSLMCPKYLRIYLIPYQMHKKHFGKLILILYFILFSIGL